MRLTYYLDVFSSWCYWAEPSWAALKNRYAGRVEFDWRIALMNRADFPGSRAQCDWFYRRSGGTVVHSPFMLHSGWVEERKGATYTAPNLVAEAARQLGAGGDDVRLALARAALRDGRKIARLPEAVAVAAETAGLKAKELTACARSREVARKVAASTADFHGHRIDQRPAFILGDAIGDKAVLSGLVQLEPVAAIIDAMLADTAAYAAHAAHFGKPPG